MTTGLRLLAPFAVVAICLVAGCTERTPDKPDKPVVKDRLPRPGPESPLAKLSAADRKLAEAQKWCAVENDKLLGDMGVPYKATIKDQPVFLCCKGCLEEAEAHPDKTLAKVEELKAKANAEKEK
jgi:hypothetical protein